MRGAVETVVTGFGDHDTGGGAFVVGPDGTERIDWLASTGLGVDPAQGNLARLLRDPSDGSDGELLLYDTDGVGTYRRIRGLSGAHGIVWHEGSWVVASTWHNQLLWLDPTGVLQRVWAADGLGDAWHLNSLVVRYGRLFASAFGRFPFHRGWAEPHAAQGQGFVFEVETGAVLLDGLSFPHDPTPLGDGWAICDSGTRAVVIADEAGIVRARRSVDGLPRGLAVADDSLLVGVSALRGSMAGARAHLLCLDARTLAERWRTDLPCREIYDVCRVPASLVDGLRSGFGTNSLRVGDRRQRDLFAAAGKRPVLLWPTGDPLPAEACSTDLRIDLPSEMRPQEPVDLEWVLTNNGGAVLAAGGPHPVSISWRWFDIRGEQIAEGHRVPLPHSVAPGETVRGWIRVLAPAVAANPLLLRVSAVQEQVRWFDDLHAGNGVATWMAVAPAGAGRPVVTAGPGADTN